MTSAAGRFPQRKTFLTGFRPRAHVSTGDTCNTHHRKAHSSGSSATAQSEATQFANSVLPPADHMVMQSDNPTDDSIYRSWLNGVSPLSTLPPHSTIPTPTKTRHPYAWSPLEASINSWITAHIVQ
jgi:hypothetical protein